MPNHITNRLRFGGEKEKVQELIASLTGENGAIDFEKIVPMPKELKIDCNVAVEHAVQDVLNNEAGQMRQNPLSFDDQAWDEFIQGLQNYRKYGFFCWYDWSVENWGTKWNAYAIKVVIERDGEIALKFETAWAAPIKVIKALSMKFPEVEIKLEYSDEAPGYNTGVCIFKGGEEIESFLPEEESSEALDLYTELHTWAENEKPY